MNPLETTTHPDGTRRVEPYRNADGTYRFEGWAWADDEQSCVPLSGYVTSITDSLESAECKAPGRVRWLQAR